jgi:hypothetical protein
MSLTVPKAGVIAGRAAQPNVTAPNIGGPIAQLGDKMMQVGTALAQDQRQHQYSEARIEMMKGLNNLRLEFQQVGDPDAIERDFPQRATQLRDQIVGGLDPHIQQDAGLLFDELEVPHLAALGQQSLGLRQSADLAQLDRTTQATVETGATTDPQTQQTYVAALDEHLNSLVAKGVISPQDAEARRQKAMGEMRTAKATQLLDADPQGLINGIDKGEFTGMDPSTLQGFRARATGAVAANAKAAQLEAERAQKEAVSQATSFLSEGASVFGKGHPWTGSDQADALLKDPAVAGTKAAREYMGAQKLFEVMPEFSKLPLAQKEKLYDEQAKKPISEGYEANVANAMKASIEADRKGFAQDRFAYAAELGLKAATELPDPTTASAQDLAKSLHARAAYSASLTQSGYVDDFKMFSPQEAAAWKEQAGLNAPPAERAKLAVALASALGPDAGQVSSEIGAGPVFGFVGGLMAHGGTESLARDIFSGQRAIKDQDVKMPPVADRRQTFFTQFKGLFDDGTQPGSIDETPARNQVIAAADALYAYRGRGDADAMDGQIDEHSYMQALHEVMGGTGDFDRKDARGGIQDVRGHQTILPPGMRSGDLENALNFVHDTTRQGSAMDETWRQISPDKGVPVIGGQPLSGADNDGTWRNTYLRAASGSTFNLVVQNPATGRSEYIYDDHHNPYVLDINALMRLRAGAQ